VNPPRPLPTPDIVDRLRDRAAAQDAKPPTTPESAAEARANLVRQLATESDPDAIKSIAGAIVALDKIMPPEPEPEPEPEDEEPIDYSGMSTEALKELREAVEVWGLPKAEREEYLTKARAKREAEEAERRRERERLQDLAAVGHYFLSGYADTPENSKSIARICERQGFGPYMPAAKPAPVSDPYYPTKSAGEGWRK
jgi:hypothetical protein